MSDDDYPPSVRDNSGCVCNCGCMAIGNHTMSGWQEAGNDTQTRKGQRYTPMEIPELRTYIESL